MSGVRPVPPRPGPADPAAPLTVGLAPPRILLVCTANRCRSPLAAALLRRTLRERGRQALVASAGLLPGGVPVPPDGLRLAGELGLDLAAHRSRQLTPGLLAAADLVVTMAREHARHVVAAQPDAFARTFTLAGLAEWLVGRPVPVGVPLGAWLDEAAADRPRSVLLGQAGDVGDPVGRPFRVWRSLGTTLEESVSRVATALAPGLPPAATAP